MNIHTQFLAQLNMSLIMTLLAGVIVIGWTVTTAMRTSIFMVKHAMLILMMLVSITFSLAGLHLLPGVK